MQPPTSHHLEKARIILEMNEIFEDIDGEFQFTATLVVYGVGSDIYHATSRRRYSQHSEVRAEHLVNDVLIPAPAYSPLFSPQFTKAPDPVPFNVFVKRPRLVSYDRISTGSRPNEIANSVFREVEICELLRQHPHPNIAAYHGCQVYKGRITGICFAKYPSTLMEKVNPGKHMKRKARSVRQGSHDYTTILQGIEEGIKHLHSMGLVHNDINPSNIMLSGDVPVLIDFGSCRREGESLEDVGRTYEWYDENVKLSLPRNDIDALDEIRIWLGNGTEPFHFGG